MLTTLEWKPLECHACVQVLYLYKQTTTVFIKSTHSVNQAVFQGYGAT